jgi:transposase
MRQKRSQIKAKDHNKAVDKLTFLVGLCGLLPLPSSWKTILIETLTFVLDILSNADSAKDSTNSHTPTGKTIIKPARIRDKGKHKIGGQDGHEGTTHSLDPNPTEVKYLTPPGLEINPDGSSSNPEYKVVDVIVRQVHEVTFDKEVIEYRVLVFENTKTGERVSMDFPGGVSAPLQFGDRLKSMTVYLRDHQHLSYERLAELVHDMFGISICEATLVNIIRAAEASPVLDEFQEAAIIDITQASRVNGDETGMSVSGQNHWVHILVGSMFTLFSLHKSGGEKGMNAIGLIKKLTCYFIHDCWASYFKFPDITHCLCNAHLVRELRHASENGSKWAERMKEHLLNLHDEVEAYGGQLPLALRMQAVDLYRRIIAEGLYETGGVELARPPGQKGKRGKMKKTKERNLLERMQKFEDAVLRFITDKNIPFTNNDAERPVRMLKIHSKISGCFKSVDMAEGFCKMRSYIVTCKNNGISAYHAIEMLVKGQTPNFIKDTLIIDERKAA